MGGTNTSLCLQKEEFVVLLEKGQIPHTRHARGSNYCLMNVFADRIPGRAIIISVVSFKAILPHSLQRMLLPNLGELCDAMQIDNLVKGASGQALQNLNLMMGIPEDTGLLSPPLFP